MSFELLAGAVALSLAARSQNVKPLQIVQNAERADGCLQPIQDFLRWWRMNGPFPIVIPDRGGLRIGAADAVWQATQAGKTSNAATLAETPHGRGAALDVWPLEFNPSVPWPMQPEEIKHKFSEFQLIARSFGFETGEAWRSGAMPYGDQPHMQIPGWRNLPYPPLNVKGYV